MSGRAHGCAVSLGMKMANVSANGDVGGKRKARFEGGALLRVRWVSWIKRVERSTRCFTLTESLVRAFLCGPIKQLAGFVCAAKYSFP